MAKLVQILGVTHNPLLARKLQAPVLHPGIVRIREEFAALRQHLAAARPDLLLAIGSDHLCQWFMDNMPAFLVGKAPLAAGPFPHERRQFGLAPYQAAVAVDHARALVEQGFQGGVDFAWSDEFTIDHSFTLPLGYLRPEADLPLVPVFTNVLAPPIPPASRFLRVGEVLRDALAGLPAELRVAVVCSGHLSLDVGGRRTLHQFSGALDAEFDARLVDLIARGDIEGLLREASWERLLAAGNAAPGFLNFVLLAGLAGGRRPVQADCVLADTGSAPFFRWDFPDREAP